MWLWFRCGLATRRVAGKEGEVTQDSRGKVVARRWLFVNGEGPYCVEYHEGVLPPYHVPGAKNFLTRRAAMEWRRARRARRGT